MPKINSVLSYVDRGPWGKSGYRGNCSGYVIKDLIENYFPNSSPKQFIEVFSGGGTGEDVAKSLGINNSVHLDLINGWNALTDEIPLQADFIFSHPPYWNIINYQAVREDINKDDLSSFDSYENFIKSLNLINKKIYDALLPGGIYAMLIGDVRKKGQYYSLQKDLDWYGNLIAHLIKIQNNTKMENFQYTNMNFIPILHEHILVFKKPIP
ncbi:DNA methyltransferase [Jeotgalibaca caeni]|uniref:DNA methyltransferase n=1 Tax=Jeotgalibaca caeni TaxID=3028623 RepID=UPI00237DD9E5|nr:DNA methyltransferase [Jeotgalibaca caeni]MDE1549983.1 DNA methyltransferase [Jeotgalibaca caeni]